MKSEGKIEQPQSTTPETFSLEALELKANLNPEQKDYLEKLKAQRGKILQGKTVKQLAESGDLETLKMYNAILGEILYFLQNKKMKIEGITLFHDVKGDEKKKILSGDEIKGIIMEVSKSGPLDYQGDLEYVGLGSRGSNDENLNLEFALKNNPDIRYRCESDTPTHLDGRRRFQLHIFREVWGQVNLNRRLISSIDLASYGYSESNGKWEIRK